MFSVLWNDNFYFGNSVAGDTVHYEEKYNRQEIQLHYISYRILYRRNDWFENVERMKDTLNCVYKEKGNFEDLRNGGLTKGNCNRYVGSKVIRPNA